jgi:hypothetical protein
LRSQSTGSEIHMDRQWKSWMAPVLVAVLVLPISATFAFLGPFFGLMMGGVLAVALVSAAVLAGEGPPPPSVRRRRERDQAARPARRRGDTARRRQSAGRPTPR